MSVKFDKAASVILAPNPVKEQLIIKLQQENYFNSLSIFDASGKLILKQKITSLNVQLDVHQLPKGWYVLKLDGKRGEQYSFIRE